jgi:hypothetical protein
VGFSVREFSHRKRFPSIKLPKGNPKPDSSIMLPPTMQIRHYLSLLKMSNDPVFYLHIVCTYNLENCTFKSTNSGVIPSSALRL